MSAHHARRGMLVAVAVLSTMLLSAPARADTVTQWNEIAANALLRDANQGAAVANANLAMIHGAVYDAVNAIDGRYEPYLVAPPAKRWYSQDAAAATAAYRVLVDSQPALLPPAQQPALVSYVTPLYDAALAAIPAGRAKDGGVATGNAAADAMIAARANDGRFGPFRFAVGTLPGQWRPVLPAFVNDPGAWLKDVKPFVIDDPSRFAGDPPYPLTSRRYADELDEVKTLGAIDSTTRTPDQTAAGRFWGLTNAGATWASLVRAIAGTDGRSTADHARMFALVYLPAADAGITVWGDKAKFSFWRPITAIREADTDGNPRTVADPDWLPLVPTPPYPDQPSGLSALGGAGATALEDFYGTDAFTFGTTNAIGITRSYASFSQVAREIVGARVWSGIHFRHTDETGVAIGERVARYVDHHALQPAHDHHGGGRF
ncbi:MAG TPA: vanadium-dependent haloperoxidase [Baekduia sp.]